MGFQRAIVVGASSGIGHELAKLLAGQGCRVAAVSRRGFGSEVATGGPKEILSFQHDVRDISRIPALFQEITGALGGLDLIVYASGVMPAVGPEEFDIEKDREMIEVNFLGAVAWLNLAAQRFQGTGAGTIAAIGSVAGDRGRAGQPVYNASKSALATYLEALRNRLHRRGVTVVTVKPGPVRTPMTAHLALKNAPTAEEAAKIILSKLNKTGEHYLQLPHRIIFAIIRNIPGSIFRRLKL